MADSLYEMCLFEKTLAHTNKVVSLKRSRIKLFNVHNASKNMVTDKIVYIVYSTKETQIANCI